MTTSAALQQAYDEGAFRYFLTLEQRRAKRSGRAFWLILVSLDDPAGSGRAIDTTMAATLFARLWRCFRETDFIGWYREGRVAGVVLTEMRDGVDGGIGRLAVHRVRSALCDGLPADVAHRLHVEVYPHSFLSQRPWLGPEESGDASCSS
jgi:hypothetical protein